MPRVHSDFRCFADHGYVTAPRTLCALASMSIFVPFQPVRVDRKFALPAQKACPRDRFRSRPRHAPNDPILRPTASHVSRILAHSGIFAVFAQSDTTQNCCVLTPNLQAETSISLTPPQTTPTYAFTADRSEFCQTTH